MKWEFGKKSREEPMQYDMMIYRAEETKSCSYIFSDTSDYLHAANDAQHSNNIIC